MTRHFWTTEKNKTKQEGRKDVSKIPGCNSHFSFDLDALDALPNIKAVRPDVTKQDEIDAAVEMVRAGGNGLYGVVNNAGVLTMGPLAEIDEDELAEEMALFGVQVSSVNPGNYDSKIGSKEADKVASMGFA